MEPFKKDTGRKLASMCASSTAKERKGGKKWTLLFDEFITLALTSTFSRDEPELYNPLAGFRGQQQRGAEGPGKSLSPRR